MKTVYEFDMFTLDYFFKIYMIFKSLHYVYIQNLLWLQYL